MRKYFFITTEDTRNAMSSAFAPENTRPSFALYSDLINESELPFKLELKKLTTEKSGILVSSDLSDIDNVWKDFLPNSLAWPLFSERMRGIIDDYDFVGGVSWIKAVVQGPNEEVRQYYIPKFIKRMDTVDLVNSIKVPGTNKILKPCFSWSKIRNLHFFHGEGLLWQITHDIYLSSDLLMEFEGAGITGIDSSEACVTSS